MRRAERFEGKVALVTGAAAGIGRAVTIALAAEGAAVGALDVSREGLEATVEEIGQSGGTARSLVADLASAEQVNGAVAETVATFGGIDLLANVAGVMRFGTVLDCDEETWDLVFDTNVKSQFLLAQQAIPQMRRRGGGAIVNVSSVLGCASTGGAAAYAASKGAVIALSRELAIDHIGEGIRTNCVVPGNVDTPMFRSAVALHFPDAPEAAAREAGRAEPLGRLIEPTDVADLVLFLLGPEAAAINGDVCRVDGGLLAKLAASPDAVRARIESEQAC